MDNLENRLRSLKPRGPSPSLSRKLFGETLREPEFVLWRWLTPVMACFMAAGLMLGSARGLAPVVDHANGNRVLAMLGSSNLDHRISGAFTLSKVDLNLERNLLVRATFDWTNGSQSSSSIPSLPSASTNFSIH